MGRLMGVVWKGGLGWGRDLRRYGWVQGVGCMVVQGGRKCMLRGGQKYGRWGGKVGFGVFLAQSEAFEHRSAYAYQYTATHIYIYRVLIAVQIQWCFSIVEHTRQTKHTNVLQEWVCHECHKDLTRTCMYMDKTPTAKIYVHVHKQIRHHLRTLLLSPFLSRAICSSLLIFSPRSLCPTHSRSDSLCVHIYKDGY